MSVGQAHQWLKPNYKTMAVGDVKIEICEQFVQGGT